jgi:hypothetical protein
MDIILIKVLIAHFIGDFFLQPNSWVEEKECKKIKSPKLYLHVLIHVLLIFVVCFSFDVYGIAIIVGLFHLVIDILKLHFQTEKNKRFAFFIDQALHVISIFIAWRIIYNSTISFDFFNEPKTWAIILSACFLTMPSSIIMRVIIAKWIPTQNNENSNSLQSAGKYIGILERLLVLLFVLTNHFEAVGFLLAAKSIFRFGDLKEANDIKLTEYVLIGTLLSFGLALTVALLCNQLYLI